MSSLHLLVQPFEWGSLACWEWLTALSLGFMEEGAKSPLETCRKDKGPLIQSPSWVSYVLAWAFVTFFGLSTSSDIGFSTYSFCFRNILEQSTEEVVFVSGWVFSRPQVNSLWLSSVSANSACWNTPHGVETPSSPSITELQLTHKA